MSQFTRPIAPSADLSLEALFAAADAITDHRSPRERNKYARRTKAAIAELAESIGYDCESGQ